jgi:ligand-binding sensor domain-containing protein/signal transduction histidine kinase
MHPSVSFLRPSSWSWASPVELSWPLFVLFVAVAGNALSAGAKPLELQLSEYQKQNWQVEDGLPENNVRMIAQRADGRLLLATSSGLSTFDGLHFQALPISGSSDGEAVNAFLEDKDGTLWIGTDGRGVLRSRPSGDAVNISEQAGRMNERIRNFYRDASGALWIATQNGIERYRDGRLEVLGQAGMISGDITTPFADDGRGGIFFITSNGLFHWSGDRWKPYVPRDRALGKPVAVYRDLQERLWVGTMSGVLQLIPRKSGGYDEVTRAHITSRVTVLTGDSQGNLWVGTRQGGVRRIGEGGVDAWTSRDGLADDSICSMFVDSAQDLWIGTQAGGLSRWRKGAFATYAEVKGIPILAAANAFSDSRGDLWLGTWGQGLFRLHDGRLANVTPPGMPVATAIRTMAENQRGQMWIGTWFDGVYRYDGHSYRHYLLGTESPGNAVSSILVDRDGGLWIGTYIGLLYFAGGDPQGKRSLFLDSKLITCMLEDRDGSILVGTSTGLFRVRQGQSMPIADLANPHVLSITRDSLGYTWIGTKTGGLAVLRKDRVEPLAFKNGLAMLPVHTAVEDGDGDLWLGTLRGIVRVNISALHDVADGRESSLTPVFFGREDGMRSSECVGTSLPASTRTKDGTLWFVTAKGFVRTTDVAEKLVHAYPMVPILGWTLSDDLDPSHARTGDSIVMGPAQPDVTFLFNIIDLSNPSQVEFRYRLAGYDADWIVSRGRSARYRRLPAGNYRFEVQARNSGEDWGSTIAGLQVQQRSHFYQTWYAYLGMVLLVGLMILQAFRQRVQLVKGQIGVIIEERNRIARECHDTLMAGLAAVSWQLEVTAKQFRHSTPAADPASNTAASPAANSCEMARSMVSHCQAEARRIIWDLRDTEEMTGMLSRALLRMISAHDSPGSIAVVFQLEGDEVPLAPADVHHLVCIAQEAVTNSLRHASPTQIEVNLRYEDASLCLSVRDDGCGLRGDTSKVGHFGIPVMEERARKVGGVLRLQSSYEEGTEVSVSVSFNSLKTLHPRHTYVLPWIGT